MIRAVGDVGFTFNDVFHPLTVRGEPTSGDVEFVLRDLRSMVEAVWKSGAPARGGTRREATAARRYLQEMRAKFDFDPDVVPWLVARFKTKDALRVALPYLLGLADEADYTLDILFAKQALAPFDRRPPLPRVRSISPGSVDLVVVLTQDLLVVSGAAAAVLGLVKKYWNLGQKLTVESERLKAEIMEERLNQELVRMRYEQLRAARRLEDEKQEIEFRASSVEIWIDGE